MILFERDQKKMPVYYELPDIYLEQQMFIIHSNFIRYGNYYRWTFTVMKNHCWADE